MSFNNSYGEEPGKGRASWAVPGAATALPALPQAALRTPPARSCGRRVRAGQDGGRAEPAWEVRLLGQGLFLQAGDRGPPPLGLPAQRRERSKQERGALMEF